MTALRYLGQLDDIQIASNIRLGDFEIRNVTENEIAGQLYGRDDERRSPSEERELARLALFSWVVLEKELEDHTEFRSMFVAMSKPSDVTVERWRFAASKSIGGLYVPFECFMQTLNLLVLPALS